MIMEILRFQPGDLAICLWQGQSHTQNNGIIVKIVQHYPVEDLPQWVLDQSPPGDVFWWAKSCGTPLRYLAKKNLVKRQECLIHDSALRRLCGAPTKRLEKVA